MGVFYRAVTAGVKTAATADQLLAGLRRVRRVRFRRPVWRGVGSEPSAVLPYLHLPPALEPLRGSVLMPPGGVVKALQNIPGRRQTPLSPAGSKALNALGYGHEVLELGVPAHLHTGNTPFSRSHASIGVLAREHNMRRRLTGPGADEARATFARARAVLGDDAALDHALNTLLGSRALAMYGQGSLEKIPRALIKQLEVRSRAAAEAWLGGPLKYR